MARKGKQADAEKYLESRASVRQRERETVAKIYRRRSFARIKREADARRLQATVLGNERVDTEAQRKVMMQTGQVTEAARARSQRMLNHLTKSRKGMGGEGPEIDPESGKVILPPGKPSLELAEIFRRAAHPTEMINDWFEYVHPLAPLAKIGQVLGPGMELYFRTLRMLGMVLVLAFFLAYCWIYVANYGIFYDKDGSPFALNRPVFFRTAGGVGTKVTGIELNGASLAAVPVQSNATIQEAMNSFIKYDIKGTATNYVKQGTFLYFIEGMSLLIGLIVYIFIQVTRLRATRIVRRVDEDTIEVSDYTVYVRNMPKQNVSAGEVAEWFTDRFGKVAEVQLASDDQKLFDRLFKRSELMMELKRARERVKINMGTRKTVRAIKAKVEKLDVKLQRLQKRAHYSIVGAFVTFNAEESKNKCLALLSPDWLNMMWRPHKYRFNGARVYANQAEPPTNINYRNLQFGEVRQFFRRAFSFAMSVIVLVVSFLIISEIRYRVRVLSSTLVWDKDLLSSYAAVLPSAIDAATSSPYNELRYDAIPTCEDAFNDATSTVLDDTYNGNSLSTYYKSVSFSYGAPLTVQLTTEAATDDTFTKNGDNYVVVQALIDSYSQASDTSLSPDQQGTYAYQSMAFGCYCTGLWARFEQTNRVDKTILDAITTDCSTFAGVNAQLKDLATAASFVTTIFNFIIQAIGQLLARFEGHHTVTNVMASQIVKQAILQWINTGFIQLIASARFRAGSSVTRGRFGAGFYEDFTQAWYSDVGDQLLRTVLIAAFAPLAMRFLTFVLSKWSRKKAVKKAIIQEDLNKGIVGPPFDVAKENADLLMIMLTVMMYAGGLPLMFIILAFKCLIQYYVDRAMVLRVCRTPPRLNDRITHTVLSVFTFALFLYVIMTAWMLSFFVTPDVSQIADKRFNSNLSRYTTTIDKSGTPNLTNDGNYNAARVLQTNAFFLFLSAVLMVAYFVVWKRVLYPIVIVFVVRGVLGGLLRTFTACCRGRARWKKGEQMDFYEAYRTGRLQGTPTYAIIDQPEFKAHFELDVALHEPDDDLPDSEGATDKVVVRALTERKRRGKKKKDDDDDDDGEETASQPPAEEDKDEEATEEGNMSTAAGNALSFLPKLW